MYMRVTRARMDPVRLDEAGHREVGKIWPRPSGGSQGVRAFMGGVDRASGRAITVSTWDTEEHARLSPNVLGDIPSRIQALATQAEPPEMFEVTIT